MENKKAIKELALFGGAKLFDVPKSTSNLLQPNIDVFLRYSQRFYEKKHYTNNGPCVRLLEKRLAEFHQVDHCITFSTGFWGLALAMRVLALPEKTEIIMPSLTYRRMTDITSWVGLTPHFCEVDENTLAMQPATVEACIGEKTALILAVHPIVNCSDAGALTKLGKKHGLPVLFDSVESVYETTKDGKIGGFGDAECFSLHACKLFNGFGGGYLTTNNTELATQLASLRTYGFVGQDNIAWKYGLNAKLNEVHAAMTLASMDDIEDQVQRNKERYETYKQELADVSGLRLLQFDEASQSGYKNIVVKLTKDWPLSRETTIQFLNAENILARAYYYPPLHQKMSDETCVNNHLPVTDALSLHFLNLPCGHLVSNEDIRQIVSLLRFLHAHAGEISTQTQKEACNG